MVESIENDFIAKIQEKPNHSSAEILNKNNENCVKSRQQVSVHAESTTLESIDIPLQPPIQSKKQRKKLLRLAQWEEKKKEKRIKEREKYKQKRKEAVEKGLPTRVGPSRKELKRNKATNSNNFLKVAIDLDYDDLMIDKDVSKCVKQLLRIYTINRRSRMPAKLHFTGIKENGRIYDMLKKYDGYQKWDVEWYLKPYTEIFNKDQIIYLSSDSENVINELKENEVYVIGGLVDHNHQKGLCQERAQKLGIKTARLPLNEHVEMKTRTVLSTYHVYEILLRLTEGKNWTEAILQTIPKRKGAKSRELLDSSPTVNTGDDLSNDTISSLS